MMRPRSGAARRRMSAPDVKAAATARPSPHRRPAAVAAAVLVALLLHAARASAGSMDQRRVGLPRRAPIVVPLSAGCVRELGAGWQHAFVVLADGTVQAW